MNKLVAIIRLFLENRFKDSDRLDWLEKHVQRMEFRKPMEHVILPEQGSLRKMIVMRR